MKLLQLIKNKFINKKAIANIKIVTEPEKGNGGTISISSQVGCYGGGGSAGSGIPIYTEINSFGIITHSFKDDQGITHTIPNVVDILSKRKTN